MKTKNKNLTNPSTKKKWKWTIVEKPRLIFLATIFAICILISFDEILDLPNLLRGEKTRPTDWIEFATELSAILLVGISSILLQRLAELQRKRAEEALKQSEREYRGLFESAHDAIIIFTPEGEIILDANQRACDIYGFDRSEFVGMSLEKISKDIPRGKREIQATLNKGFYHNFETVQYRKDGTEMFMDINGSVVDYKGKMAILSINRDITERKKAEVALRESEEQFRQLAENIDQVFWLTDWENNKLLYVNPSYEKFFGRSCQSAYEDRLSWYEVIHPDDRAPVRESLVQNAKLGQNTEIEYRIVRDDGAIHWIFDRNYPIRDKHGKVYRIVSIAEDITERKRAEEMLRISEKFLNSVIENTPNPMWISDENGTVIRMNQALRDLLKISDAEVIGKYNVLKDSQVKEQGLLPLVTSVFEEGKTIEFEIDYITTQEKQVQLREEAHKILDIIISPIKNNQGKVINAIAQHKDITERKRAEEAMRMERDRLEEVTKNIGAGLAIISKDYRTVWANQVLKEIFGEVEGKICYSTYNQRNQICPACGVQEIFETGKDKVVHEQVGRDKDGNSIWSQIVATPIRDQNGNVTAALELVVPITERKKAEEALQVSHHFLEIANWHTEMTSLLQEFAVEVQNFTGAAAVGLRILDEKGNIPYQTYEGFSREFYELESPLSTKSDQCMCINVIKGVTDPNLPFYTEGGSFCMNGTTRFLASVSEEVKGRTRNACNQFGYESVALVPIRLGERILGLIHVADPHENMFPLEMVKVLERAAMQVGIAIQRVWSEEEIRKKNKELEAFVYMVSHDLKNPVVSIQGFCSSILKNQRDQLNEKTLFYLQRVQANASLMSSLLEDLVELSRIGRIEDKKTEISAQGVIKSVWAGVSTSLATPDVEFVCPENLPRLFYSEKRLYQIFSNLLSNALKFRDEDRKTKVEIGHQEDKDNYTFFVRDNGIGIEQKYHNKIFESFSQLKDTKSEGTGMGLAIVKKIVEANQGKVWVESQKKAGSTFYFTIPKNV